MVSTGQAVNGFIALLVWLLQLFNPQAGDQIRELTPPGYQIEEDGSGTFPAYHQLPTPVGSPIKP
jgi:hypothetical protein